MALSVAKEGANCTNGSRKSMTGMTPGVKCA